MVRRRVRLIRKFRVGSSLSNRIESESSLSIRIEYRSFAEPYSKAYTCNCRLMHITDSASRHLHSASRHHLTEPRHWQVLSILGPSLSQVRRSGIHYRTASVTRRSAVTVLDNVEDELISALLLSTHSAV